MITYVVVGKQTGQIGTAHPLVYRQKNLQFTGHGFKISVHDLDPEPIAYMISDGEKSIIVSAKFAHNQLEFLGEL